MIRFAHIGVASLLLLVGCTPVDNSGGEPPDGDRMAPTTLMKVHSLACGFYEDRADIIREIADADALLAGPCSEATTEGATELSDAVWELQPGRVAVVVTVQLGGCRGAWAVQDFYESNEGAMVTAWVLRGDTSYGVEDAMCTDDIGEAVEVWNVPGVDDGASAQVIAGVFNPDLPDPPEL